MPVRRVTLKGRDLLGKLRARVAEYLLTLPSFGWLVLFFVVPTVLVFLLSFRAATYDGAIAKAWSLTAWQSLSNPSYPAIIWRTIWLSAVSTLLCIVIALPCAFAMARASERLRHIMVSLVIVPFWTNFLVRVFAWRMILHPDGAVKSFLVTIGLIAPEQQLLYNSGAVLLVMVYTYLPFAILPLYAAAEKFDFNLIEAATDLGAGPWRAFRTIFIPGIRVGIFSATMMVLIPALGSYVIPDMVGGASSEMLGSKIAQRAIPDRNLPQASALSAMLTLGVLIPPLIGWMFFRRRNIDLAPPSAAATDEVPGKAGV